MKNKQGYLIPKNEREIDYTSSSSRLKLKPVNYMSNDELLNVPAGDVWFFDVECYINFFFIAFKHAKTSKLVTFEQSPCETLITDKLSWMLWRFTIVGFNSINYDIPIITLALKGVSCAELKSATNFIIVGNNTPWVFEKHYGVEIQKYNHIDIIEVAPLQGSLKLYAGRLHCKTMQDLPFKPEHVLTEEDAKIIRPYCCNDLDNTELLFNELAEQLQLRCDMSKEYDIDLRSKSDAQIAEAVICSELKKTLGYYPRKSNINIETTTLQYNCPDFISFNSPALNKILSRICDTRFNLDKGGSPMWPVDLGGLYLADDLSENVKKIENKKANELKVKIGNTTYKIGMGGLHSQEEKMCNIADENTHLRDHDVTSYYPQIILNQGLFPPHLGEAFLQVYQSIVTRRVKAKGILEIIAATLKIVINGSFGKLGSRFSRLFAPQLMLQVTITGQLCLLMLIEMLEEIEIDVVSGNTDGVICKYDKNRVEEVRNVISLWETKTDFKTEEVKYKAVYSRDVNNYIAVKEDGKIKKKGCYSEAGLSKNPKNAICVDAVSKYLTEGITVEETVRNCTDVSQFVSVRNVRGGGEKDGVYLGKVVRFYYGKNEQTCIKYVESGNKVPESDGAKPLMDLPTNLPEDLDYNWYINAATDMLTDCGAIKEPETGSLFDFF